MVYKIYVMRDQMTGFMTPTFELNDSVAIRNFKFALNKNDLLYANATHFDLYYLGEYDTESGHLKSYEPQLICTGVSCIEKKGEIE